MFERFLTSFSSDKKGIVHAEEALLLALIALAVLAAYGPLANSVIATFEGATRKLLDAI